MKVVAIINVFNEDMIISQCLDHLSREGISFYIINNASTDRTLDIVRSYESRGLIGFKTLADNGHFKYRQLLLHKQELARTLDADWFLHYDADEFRTSNQPGETLVQAFERIDKMGFNAINFQEFTFIPTEEQPYHHPDSFIETMRWYYPFLPSPLHRLNAWKAGVKSLDLITNGGHRIIFDGIKIYPESLWLRHYMYMSREHFLKKYKNRLHDVEEVQRGWHGWRNQADERLFYCPPLTSMRRFNPAEPWNMDASEPEIKHMLESRRT